MEDAGIYRIDVVQTNGKAESYSCNVTVYDYVPSPYIQREVTGYRTDGCNVTLQCSVPSHPSHLSYTWKYRDQDQEYQPYDSGSTTQISLAPDHQDMEILCIVHNPADHKNVSVQMKDLCHDERPRLHNRRGDTCWIKMSIYLPLLAVLSLLVAVLSFLKR
ncbi:SLAM family member 5-like [Engystomops pustulosus]|uniref:SLAM family member 5-like n=1 Tax=Engystomops pustulosus TaxID=76066 RepID=UPI003AFB402D